MVLMVLHQMFKRNMIECSLFATHESSLRNGIKIDAIKTER
jgi:hypothetical protein